METPRWHLRLENLENAFKRFSGIRGEYQNHPTHELYQLALIQSFEFTFELSWKTLTDFLEHQGIPESLPRDVIKKAFHFSVIPDGQPWIDMLEDRNRLSHEYNENQALKITQKIAVTYFSAIERMVADLAKRR